MSAAPADPAHAPAPRTAPRPMPSLSPASAAALRADLALARYDAPSILRRLGVPSLAAMRREFRPILLERTASSDPLDTLIRLFLLHGSVDSAVAQRALPNAGLAELLTNGVLEVEPNAPSMVTSWLDIRPFESFLVISDGAVRAGTMPAPDYVMSVGGSTEALAAQMLREPSRLTLDLGCGSGVLSLIASTFSDRVIGVDLNPRAIALARLNAALNDVRNVEFHVSDLYTHVAGRRFDRILSNPPFVISPEQRFLYRDGGRPSDSLTEAVIRGACEHLAEGGIAQVLCNWAHLVSTPGAQRVAGWVAGTGCDCLLLPRETKRAGDYAAAWIADTERNNPATELWERWKQWVGAYRDLGIEAVSIGMVTVRRRTANANWFEEDVVPDNVAGSAADHLRRMIDARDILSTFTPQDLAASRFVPSSNLRIEQESAFYPGSGWSGSALKFRLDHGYEYRGELDGDVASLLMHLDGTRTLVDAVNAAAERLGRNAGDLVGPSLRLVAHFLRRGIIIPMPDAGA